MTEPLEPTVAEPGPDPGERKPRFARLRRLSRRRRFLLGLILFIGAGGVIVGVGGTMAVEYSESASFCTKCHTMEPQKKAYEASPHKDVACGECHVRPGVKGFVSAKLAGTKELYKLVRGTYPRPILPPDHDELPPVEDSCLQCHSLKDITRNGGPIKLVLRTTYQTDRTNTREQVAVVIRPAGLEGSGAQSPATPEGIKGVHWHVQQEVAYTSSDRQDQTIDLVSVTDPDGSERQWVRGSQVNTSEVADGIARLKGTEKNRVMDCLSCHNRVGHQAPSLDEAVDTAMATGEVSPSLPYIKREAVAVLGGAYDSTKDADRAIDQLRVKYPISTPAVAGEVDSAVAALKRIYDQVATPGMKVTATTYANNLGHQNSPGCFRCHDGKHFLVVKDQITKKAIPSACTTCHTFPQAGPRIAGVAVGGRPTSHTATFVFDHKRVATSVLPTGTACATCHVPTFCQNCHDSGAIDVNHDVMLYRHGEASRIAGTDSCMYCHQSSSCTQCHQGTIPTITRSGRVSRPPGTG